MFRNITFIGGIHGVGKSTICKDICTETGMAYLSASALLKWKELNNDETNKMVIDVKHTQNRLIQGLKLVVTEQNKYLLDGHYCLLGSDGAIKRVPLETFEQINPFSLNLIIGDITEIKAKLEARDNKPYNLELLRELQTCEVNYAIELSEKLDLKLSMGTTDDISQIINALKYTTP